MFAPRLNFSCPLSPLALLSLPFLKLYIYWKQCFAFIHKYQQKLFEVYKHQKFIIFSFMSRRQVKKTVIRYDQQLDTKPKLNQRSKSRSRSKERQTRVEVVDSKSRKERLAQMKRRRQAQQQVNKELNLDEPSISIKQNLQNPKVQQIKKQKQAEAVPKQTKQKMVEQKIENEENEESEEQDQQKRVLLKPVYISKQDRQNQQMVDNDQKQKERKKKAIRYTTKLLLMQNAKQNEIASDEQLINSSDQQIQKQLPNDQDTVEQQYEYQLWKIRELKRIRRDREQRRKMEKQKAEIQRRRKMNNQEILLENKVMGSDATNQTSETKYVFLQKYYHKGAFYQDSEDPIYKRDYNLPTPLQMQDKSMLPQVLQKRQGNFGKKGQSKYKHLTAEDTTNFNPEYRPDQSILANWKKKMAGYKGSGSSNI